MALARLLLISVGIASAACDFVRVPITDVNASFNLADATWFEEEETLFVFYRVDAGQGLGPETQLELTWRTDEVEQPWTPLSALTTVHPHEDIECGVQSRCGSTSVRVTRPPRDVRLRLRYHREGEMTLDAPLNFTAIATGAAHTNRSLLVYGVMDQSNTRVQWRARHQFPAIRNEEAEALGLRRHFVISDPRHGAQGLDLEGNPYGYGAAPECPLDLAPLGWAAVETTDRAVFDANTLPVAAGASAAICATARVTDARGTFDAIALARKNPEVAPAFPALRSPIAVNTPVGFRLRMCQQTISEVHRAMQEQRLLLQNAPELCLDDWQVPGFADRLAASFQAEVDRVRAAGNDMVLALSFHHDDRSGALAFALEQALQQVLTFERDRSSPRVTGAFILDSFPYELQLPDVSRLVVWCPPPLFSTGPVPDPDVGEVPPSVERRCPVQMDIPELQLGPVRATALPILPSRAQYLNFIDRYSDAQAGQTKTLTFKAPVRTPLSENVPLGEFAVATFFNNEVMTADETDRFSFCQPSDENPEARRYEAVVLRAPDLPELFPLSALPEVHAAVPQPSYGMGLMWDFPFLTRMEYETFVAGAATAVGLTVPFGIGRADHEYYGNRFWESGEIRLEERLLRCTRYCDHPTFSSGGIYEVFSPFEPNYRNQCYRPIYPAPGDGGFPFDP